MAKSRKPHQDEATPGQRALWTFLASTLIGPFFAALIILVLTLAAGAFGFGPPSLKALQDGQLAPIAAQRAIETYVWSAFPAGVAGAMAAAWLSLRGELPWLVAASSAAVATTVAAIVVGGIARDHVTPLAFIAACCGISVWLLLQRLRVLPR